MQKLFLGWFWLGIASGPLWVPGTALCTYPNEGYSQSPVDRLRHEVNNQAEEIRVLYARLATQDSLIESLSEDISKMGKASLEVNQTEAKNAQARMRDLELKVETLEKQLAKATESLGQSQRKLEILDTSLDLQNKNSRHLEKSLGTLLEAVGGESTAETTYRVVSGDSLEKIAKRFKTSVQVLKELNSLENDRIIVGKKLKVPATAS
jgi:LysM repeat protein